MDVWPWICELVNSDEWSSTSSFGFELASSKLKRQSIQLRAEKTLSEPGTGSDEALTFSLYTLGFDSSKSEKHIWMSDTCALSLSFESSDHPFLPLILQLLQSIVSRAPSGNISLQKIKPDPIIWIMDTHSPESFSPLFSLILLSHLFWLCVFNSPSEIGSFYFHSLLTPNIEMFSSKHAPIIRTFLISVGADMELCIMRTLGYILAKWLILKETEGVGLQSLTPRGVGFSYATESHGLWVMKGYVPVWGMSHTRTNNQRYMFNLIDAKESVLKYALAHQQLELVVQLEYSVRFNEGFIMVNACVDNMRIHVTKLGFGRNDEGAYVDERHFPSRVRVWVGPEVGSTYVAGMSLGRSTDNTEREVETQRIVKGKFGKTQAPMVKAKERSLSRTKTKNWRWDQDAEGNSAVFDATLCDNTTGVEVATWRPSNGGSVGKSFRKRYSGENRSFTKSGGLVFARDECGEGVGWRLSNNMEGSVLKWRIGCQIWLSYLPNQVESSYFETRCMEWCDEVDLPLIVGK